MRDVIERGFKPNIQAPLITETCGRLGTRTCKLTCYWAFSNVFFISFFKKGLSLNPPTIKMKLIGDPLHLAASMSSATFSFILSKSGMKKLVINGGGKSTDEAPRFTSLMGVFPSSVHYSSCRLLNSPTSSANYEAVRSSPR